MRQLVEYKKFKDAAQFLEQQELARRRTSSRARGRRAPLAPEPDVALQDVSLFDLITAFNEALKQVREEELREIFAERLHASPRRSTSSFG